MRRETLFADKVVLVEDDFSRAVVAAFITRANDKPPGVCAVHGTDFDPYGQLLRSAALRTPHVVIAHVGNGDRRTPDAAELTALRREHIFCSRQPLELELELVLLRHVTGPMITALTELDPRLGARDALLEDVATHLTGDPRRDRAILRRVDDFGQLRLAQRLRSPPTRVQAPEYIAAALRALAGLSRPTDGTQRRSYSSRARARPAARPEKMQPPRNVPSRAL